MDALTLAVVVWLSALPYLGRLGFYSDDWTLIAAFEAAARSGGSIIATTLPDYGVRPVQGVYLALLYDTFGLRPLGYHLVNTAVIALSAVLLHLLLLRLRFSRPEAFASALVFVLMPQLSTVRVWFAAFQIPLSMLFALAAMHALLSSRSSRTGLSSAVAVVSTCLSIGAYEIFAPLIAGFAAALLVVELRSGKFRLQPMIGPLAVLGAITLGVALKFLTQRSGELAGPSDLLYKVRVFLSPHYDWRTGYGLNVFAALDVYFWRSLADWAVSLVRLVTGRAGPAVTVTAVATAALCWWRIRGTEEQPRPLRLLLVGLAVFVLGHATFLIANSFMFSPTGIANRVMVAGAIGAAMILVALIELVLLLAPKTLRRPVFAGSIALLAAATVARLDFVENYWAEAPALQRQILTSARVDLASVPAGSTVILDGVCPYHGPAIVFETYWDIGAALSLTLDRKIAGDAVSPRMTLTRSGLATEIYDERAHYPYGSRLFVYNPRLHLLAGLTDAAAARRYFSMPERQSIRCPTSYVGQGVLI